MSTYVQNFKKATVDYYETALQKTSENTKFWSVVGGALFAIGLAIIGLSIWGAVHFFSSHAWTQLSLSAKVIFGILIGFYGAPLAAALVALVSSPFFGLGGAILYKAITQHDPKVQIIAIDEDKLL